VTVEQQSGQKPSATGYVVSAVLLLAAFVALLWVPSYSHLTPTLGGIPFFYWYSFLWLILNALCQLGAYQLMVVAPRRKQAVRGLGVRPSGAGQ
jgi:hypothetical protein